MLYPDSFELWDTRTLSGATNEYGVPLPDSYESYKVMDVPCRISIRLRDVDIDMSGTFGVLDVYFPARFNRVDITTDIRNMKRGDGLSMGGGLGQPLGVVRIPGTNVRHMVVSVPGAGGGDD